MSKESGSVGRWWRGAFRSQSIVLLYHRIAAVERDPWKICVTPQHFEEHLTVLRGYRRVPLEDAAPRQFRPFTAERSVALTFDDGYADNFSAALPLLERFETPATFFVTTGQVGRSEPFWWDELLHLVYGTWPAGSVRFSISGRPYRTPVTAEERQTLLRHLHSLLRDLDTPERDREMVVLRRATGSGGWTDGPRALTRDELFEMSRSAVAGIGAHTVSHPVLSALPGGRQREEIGASKQFLERLLGRRVLSFAYPFGGSLDYTADTEEFVIDGGFGLACTAECAPLRREHLCYRVPRWRVPDLDGDGFREWLGVGFG